jgi:hypothetical protein
MSPAVTITLLLYSLGVGRWKICDSICFNQKQLPGDYSNYYWKAMYKVIEARIMISWNGMQNTRIMYNKYFQ